MKRLATAARSNPAPRRDAASCLASPADPRALAAVVALAGARDRHQLPLALYERGLLETLVTDLFWPTRSRWANGVLGAVLDAGQLAKRACDGIDPSAV